MSNRTIQDVYATIREYRQGFPPRNPEPYPFVVMVRYSDGTLGQETQCRSLRDCLLVGNGMIMGLHVAGDSDVCPNVVFDPRFDR